MNGIESVGSTDVSRQLSNHPVGEGRGPFGMEGSLTISKKFLSAVLSETGFVDLQGGCIDKIKLFVQHSPSTPQEMEPDLDPRTAAELATYFGERVTGDMNLVLRLVARVAPERVAALLK